jgi:hypothetical protein
LVLHKGVCIKVFAWPSMLAIQSSYRFFISLRTSIPNGASWSLNQLMVPANDVSEDISSQERIHLVPVDLSLRFLVLVLIFILIFIILLLILRTLFILVLILRLSSNQPLSLFHPSGSTTSTFGASRTPSAGDSNHTQSPFSSPNQSRAFRNSSAQQTPLKHRPTGL